MRCALFRPYALRGAQRLCRQKPIEPAAATGGFRVAQPHPTALPDQVPADPVAEGAAHDEIEVAAAEPGQFLGEHRHALPPAARHAGDVGAPETAFWAKGVE